MFETRERQADPRKCQQQQSSGSPLEASSSVVRIAPVVLMIVGTNDGWPAARRVQTGKRFSSASASASAGRCTVRLYAAGEAARGGNQQLQQLQRGEERKRKGAAFTQDFVSEYRNVPRTPHDRCQSWCREEHIGCSLSTPYRKTRLKRRPLPLGFTSTS
jgi:hypothetical protein